MDNNEEVVPSGIELPTPVAAVPAPEVAAEDEPQPSPTAVTEDPLGEPVAPTADDESHEPFPEATVEELIEQARGDIVASFHEVVHYVEQVQHLLNGQLLEDFNRALHMAEAGLRVFGVEPGQG